MIMYKTRGLGDCKIEPVEVEKVSEKSVWIVSTFFKGRLMRQSRHSLYENYWNTPEEAKKHLTDTCNKKILELEKEIEMLNRALAKISII